MHKVILPAVAILALAASTLGDTPTKSKKKHHAATTTTSTTHARKHTATGPKASGTGTKATKATARRKGKASRHTARSYQQAPTPDRYREIQQALASKGYFHGEANGEWGADSADALKRFQAEQNLMPDGKINSLSLIALGLGPKRLTAAKSDAASAGPAGTPIPSTATPPSTPAAPAPPQ